MWSWTGKRTYEVVEKICLQHNHNTPIVDGDAECMRVHRTNMSVQCFWDERILSTCTHWRVSILHYSLHATQKKCISCFLSVMRVHIHIDSPAFKGMRSLKSIYSHCNWSSFGILFFDFFEIVCRLRLHWLLLLLLLLLLLFFIATIYFHSVSAVIHWKNYWSKDRLSRIKNHLEVGRLESPVALLKSKSKHILSCSLYTHTKNDWKNTNHTLQLWTEFGLRGYANELFDFLFLLFVMEIKEKQTKSTKIQNEIKISKTKCMNRFATAMCTKWKKNRIQFWSALQILSCISAIHCFIVSYRAMNSLLSSLLGLQKVPAL